MADTYEYVGLLGEYGVVRGDGKGFFVSKKRVEKELEGFEKNFDNYIEQIGDKFPTIKRVLIDDRNNYMVNQLVKADEEYDKVIAVIGDGHVPGISKLLDSKKLDYEVVRLSQLRKNAKKKTDSSTATFSLEYSEP